MNLEEMFNQIGHKPISLFYGAGVSMDCGGPSGGQLLESMKLEFGDSETDSFFEYMDYIIGDDDSKRAEVEAYMEKQLLSISPEETHKYLFSLPWGAVLTTNYDRLPDLILNSMDSKRTIFPVTDPDSGSIDQTRANLLYCFKLMGDTKSRYPNGGWPVLTSRDLKWVYSRQTQFIELFRNLSSTGHIIYLGYSFDDEIVFDILRDMKHVLKQFPWRGYAITPRKPGEYILKRMEEYGIAWVQGNLKEFIKVSKTHFGSVPTSAPSLIKKFRIHNIPIEIDEATASNIFRRFKILTDADLQSHYDNPREFFKGLDKSFAPYRNNWDYRMNPD
ncbi:MAG: SIR2 family protein [Promethearchaeia archaeon]